MNLETKIDQRLWEAIEASLEKRSYTGAILDSLHFLSDLIRQKKQASTAMARPWLDLHLVVQIQN
jgi:hypothetical protein